MTRKDYILIAKAMKESRETEKKRNEPVVDSAAHTLASYLACDNPRFDRQRFLRACGAVS